MVWLGKNSPGVTISYRSMAHIHTDTGKLSQGHLQRGKPRGRLSCGRDLEGAGDARERVATVRAAATVYGSTDAVRQSEPRRPAARISRTPAGRPRTWTNRPDARRDILRRYMDSKDVVVQPTPR